MILKNNIHFDFTWKLVKYKVTNENIVSKEFVGGLVRGLKELIDMVETKLAGIYLNFMKKLKILNESLPKIPH